MRIALVGKGGSGKTTVTTLLANQAKNLGYRTWVIDADINQHLAESMGMSAQEARSIPPLGLEIKRIKEYISGQNTRVSADKVIKTTPPGTGSNFIIPEEPNDLVKYFSKEHQGIKISVTGPMIHEEVGTHCYHSKTGAVELILNHTIDTKKDCIIVDMTAGADSFASGLFTKFDLTVIVCEPTNKSVGVYHQYREFSDPYNVKVVAIGNKVEDQEDEDFIKANIDEVAGFIPYTKSIKKIDQGQPVTELAMDKAGSVMKKLLDIAQNGEVDWENRYDQAVEFHIKNARSWANEQVGEDLEKQIDPGFNIRSIIKDN